MRRPCGKVPYPTAAEAYRAVRKARQRDGRRTRAYRCRDCTSANGGAAVWHLTSDLRATDDHWKPPRRPKLRLKES